MHQQEIGYYLSRFRQSQTDLNQPDFAIQAQLTPAVYARIERGKRQVKIIELEKIASVYRMPVAELLKRISVLPASDPDNKGLPFLKALEAAEEKYALLLAENAALTLKVLELTTMAEERAKEIERLCKLLAAR
jgi:transcriptional regulator with XRE-family HTH domain